MVIKRRVDSRIRMAAAASGVLAGMLLAVGCSSGSDESGPSGADSPQAAADAYAKALNGQDEQALRDLMAPSHSESARDAGVQRALKSTGEGAAVKVVDVNQDVSPKFASVRLGGTAGNADYERYVQLSEHDGGWWVVPAKEGAREDTGPSAGTDKPSN